MIHFAQERVGVTELPNSNVITQVRNLVDDGLYINTYRWTVRWWPAAGRQAGLPALVCGDGSNTTTLNIPDDVGPDPR